MIIIYESEQEYASLGLEMRATQKARVIAIKQADATYRLAKDMLLHKTFCKEVDLLNMIRVMV